MKYNILSLTLFFCLIIKAQVGINTNNMQGVFHIDALGNNTITGIPTVDQMTDDIVIAANVATGLNVSVGGKISSNSSAQLALLDPNKALLMNRVALAGLRDITTIPNPPVGTIVYNTVISGTYPDNIVPGYYYFNGVVWYKWQYGRVDSELSQRDLLEDCYSLEVTGLNDVNSSEQAALADFGTIQISETGTYIFSFRLYGTPTLNSSGDTAPTFTRSINYLYMMKNGSEKVEEMEINVVSPVGGIASAYTHTATLQVLLTEDDTVTFRLGHGLGWYGWKLIANPDVRANKTSLIYWKI